MNKEIDLETQPGPCVVCGEKDYSLSVGGPTICPLCDIGADLKERLDRFREEIKQLQTKIKQLKDALITIPALRPPACGGSPTGKFACEEMALEAEKALKGGK